MTAAILLNEYTLTDRGTYLSLNASLANETTIYKAATDDEQSPSPSPVLRDQPVQLAEDEGAHLLSNPTQPTTSHLARLRPPAVATSLPIVAAVPVMLPTSATIFSTLPSPNERHPMARLEEETEIPSIALGQLGPPELTKLLFEAYLLRQRYHTLERVLNQRPKKIAEQLYQYLKKHEGLLEQIVSVGVPVLAPDVPVLPEDMDIWI